jgi:apolipoprotein N-acyltransferase
MMNFAFQPWGYWGLAVLALAIFPFFRELKTSQRLLFGWMTGFWIQAFGYYWIFFTIRDFGGLISWLSGAGALLFFVYQGFDLGLWFAGTRLFVRQDRWGFFLIFDAGLLFVIQSFLFPYVFPWVLSTCLSNSMLRSSASLWSGYGLTFWLVFFSLGAGNLIEVIVRKKTLGWALLWVVLSGFALFAGFMFPSQIDDYRTLQVGVVQPNIIPWAKRDHHSFKRAFRAHVEPTLDLAKRGADLVVWPETALSIVLKNYPAYQNYLQDLVETAHCGLLIGCLGREDGGYTNEAWLFSPQREPQIYQKEKLVMFSESLPWPFFWAKYFVSDMGQFVSGTGNRVFEFHGMKIQPLICFEAMLPVFVNRQSSHLMVNITNDAWFGKTKASALHLQHIQLRTVEQVAPLVRAANSGISCWISVDGTVHDATSVYEKKAPLFSVPVPARMHVVSSFHPDWWLILVTIIIFSGSRIFFKKK